MTDVIGHASVIRELRSLGLGAEPPHALLFCGPEGTGRMLLAYEYAQLLNCERRAPEPSGPSLFGDGEVEAAPLDSIPCGECRPCRLIAERAHPDVLVLGPGDALCRPRAGESSHASHADSRDIRICQVRGLIELAARYPFEARYRVVIIEPADLLRREAANNLLKTLEEPPGHTVFILITAAPDALIETIVSRCRRIEVRPVPRQEIADALIARDLPPPLAERAALAARGRPGKALAYAAKPSLLDDRDRLLEMCGKIAAGKLRARLDHAEQLTERYRRDRASIVPELEAWEMFWETRLRESVAAGDPPETSRRIVEALGAVGRLREDLLAQVQARPAFELMLLAFPRVMLSEGAQPVAAPA